MKKKKNKNEDIIDYSPIGKFLNKWLLLLAAVIIFGSQVSFALIIMTADLMGESVTYVWMAGLLPLMLAVAVPVTVIIAKTVRKHFGILSKAMNGVASGEIEYAYVPTAGAGAFTKIYEDFNKMAAEIAGIQKLRREIVDNFSHELKTPVASINGFSKMLLDGNLTEEKKKKYIEIIYKESERLAELAANNLFLSKIDTQEIITDKKPYNLGWQIQETAIALENAWSAKSINVSADLPDAEYTGNANLMGSVWHNLLSNAIKFTPKNGDINIMLREFGDNIVVTIQDTGIGMSKEVMGHIFERYYQAETSHTGKGHGLGLSIVKRIIKLCEGQITVTSKEGEGSTFTVILPKE